jgi:hypothetical protein
MWNVWSGLKKKLSASHQSILPGHQTNFRRRLTALPMSAFVKVVMQYWFNSIDPL